MPNYKQVVKVESMSTAIAMLREAKAAGQFGVSCYSPVSQSYLTGDALDAMYTRAISGDDSLVAKAEKLMDEIESASYAVTAKTTINDVHGARLNMGEYLSGIPTCFRRHKKQSTMANVPANFYICVGFGSLVSAELTMKRGIAITALVAKLATIRPVNLYIIDENISMYDSICTTSIRLETSPLNLAQVAYCVTSPEYIDGIIYSLARIHGHMIQWPRAKRADMAKSYAAKILSQLGETELNSSLYLSGIDNAEIQSFNDPIKWVNEKLALFAGLSDEDME